MWTLEKLSTEFEAITNTLCDLLQLIQEETVGRDSYKNQLTMDIAAAQVDGLVEGSNAAKRDAWVKNHFAEQYQALEVMGASLRNLRYLEVVANVRLSNLRNQFRYLELAYKQAQLATPSTPVVAQ